MESTIQTDNQKKEYNQVLDNYNDEYWSKKYGVSAEELKQNSNKVAITAKIIEATTRKNAFVL